METATTSKGLSISVLVRSIRHLPEYHAWKRAVFLRDHFQCQHCGKRNGRKPVIEADHITPLADLVKQNNIRSVEQAKACSLLWDISNGRTLCHGCHELTESYPDNFKRKSQGVNWL